MAKITYIKDSEQEGKAQLYIDGVMIESSTFRTGIPDNVHAIQWNGSSGEIEYNDGGKNKDISDISSYGFETKFATKVKAMEDAQKKENEDYLEKLASNLSIEHPSLSFNVKFGDRIDVRGSQSNLNEFGEKMHGTTFGEYEVFHTDDDERGEIVRIIKSSSILKENKGRETAQKLISKLRSSVLKKLNDDELQEFRKEMALAFDMELK